MSVKAELTERDRRYLERSLNGPVWKVVLSVGAPLALYQELAMIFTVMDTMMAAHISKESVSAVAYLAQVNLILTAVGGGLAVGAGIQISRAYGEGDLELVRKRVSSLYALSLSVGLAMLAMILPFTVQFLRLAGTPEELIAVGSRYFMVQMFVMVFNFLNNVYIAVERARGNAKRIFVLNILSWKISHAVWQILSLCAATAEARLEPLLGKKRSHHNEKPGHHNKERPPLSASRESPHAAMKIQHSKKK